MEVDWEDPLLVLLDPAERQKALEVQPCSVNDTPVS
jgi:hypothetical protein